MPNKNPTTGILEFINGNPDISTIKQQNPLNSATRPNPLASNADMGNGLGSFPVTLNKGFAKELSELVMLANAFEPTIGMMGDYGYRQVFEKDVIPQHSNTLAKQYTRIVGMDTNPLTAPLKGLTTWTPGWNEVTITATSTTVTTSAWGRYFKNNSFADNISSVNWKLERGRLFAANASETLNKLAGMRLYEGANKIFVKSIAAFDPAKPMEPRITLGATAADVPVNQILTMDTLLEAQNEMANYEELYCTVDPTTGAIKKDNKRHRPIGGYRGGQDYKVLLGRSGQRQVFADERFRDSFVQGGGIAASGILSETIGISSPIFRLSFEIIESPITVNRSTSVEINTEGLYPLEVAFVMGGGAARIGIELSFEGYTKWIDIASNDSRKVDPFELYSLQGWMAVVDFGVIQNEALYAIPYAKNASLVVTGTPLDPSTGQWKA